MSDALRIEDYDEMRRYTYADYLKWEGPERCQLLNGEVYQMASPTVEHQAILVELLTQFHNWLKDKPYQVFAAPLDVRLFPKKDRSDTTVVQPDLLVVCDKSKLAKGSVNGAPDLIIEIVSPSNSHSELFLKYNYYLKAGVKEYWVVDPEGKKVQVNIFEKDHFYNELYEEDAGIPVTILPGLEISLKNLFSNK